MSWQNLTSGFPFPFLASTPCQPSRWVSCLNLSHLKYTKSFSVPLYRSRRVTLRFAPESGPAWCVLHCIALRERVESVAADLL